MAKWSHKDCKGHIAVGIFDGKRFKKVCVTSDQPDNVIEGNIRFAQEVSDSYVRSQK